jgi:hypothetical protein
MDYGLPIANAVGNCHLEIARGAVKCEVEGTVKAAEGKMGGIKAAYISPNCQILKLD